jgi:hypothetical protein
MIYLKFYSPNSKNPVSNKLLVIGIFGKMFYVNIKKPKYR